MLEIIQEFNHVFPIFVSLNSSVLVPKNLPKPVYRKINSPKKNYRTPFDRIAVWPDAI
jgi:hypothetical protein